MARAFQVREPYKIAIPELFDSHILQKMGSNEEKATKTKPEVSFDVEPANDGTGQPLARQLKNRHVAMIRCVKILFTPSLD